MQRQVFWDVEFEEKFLSVAIHWRLLRRIFWSRCGRGAPELLGHFPRSTTMSKLSFSRIGAWIRSKIFLYNVTYGLYMLDWWERYLFNTIMILLLCVLCYNGSRFTVESVKRLIWYFNAETGENNFMNMPMGHHRSPSVWDFRNC